MRKKLVASKGDDARPYEVTIDDQPPLEGMNLSQSFADTGESDIPEEAKLAITQGNIDQAKQLLEQAGYNVEIQDIGEQ